MSILMLDKADAAGGACRSFVGNHNQQLHRTLRKAMMFSIVGAAAVLAPACGGGPQQQAESSTPILP
jgi:hypothetical protein